MTFASGKHSASDRGSQTVCSQAGELSAVFPSGYLSCPSPFLHARSHGEALTFEPLLMEDRDQSPLRDLYIVAIATVTQVNLS